MEKMIDLECEHGQGVYVLVKDELPRGLASLTSTVESSLIWHRCLDHPSYRKLQQAVRHFLGYLFLPLIVSWVSTIVLPFVVFALFTVKVILN